MENLPAPADYIAAVLEKVKRRYIERTYEVFGWTDTNDFLVLMAKKSGKLLKVKTLQESRHCVGTVLKSWCVVV